MNFSNKEFLNIALQDFLIPKLFSNKIKFLHMKWDEVHKINHKNF